MRPADIIAVYKGEWIVTERRFSISYGRKSFAWDIEAEVPAMRYSVGDGAYELGPADWCDDAGTLSFKLATQKVNWEHTGISLGSELAGSLVAHAFVHQAVVYSAIAVDPTLTLAATVVTGYVLAKGAEKLASYASARAKARLKGGPKKPPMPGWPAINFRGGKKAKKATKKAAGQPFELKLIFDDEATASFEMADGTVKTLKAFGISVALMVDGAQAWVTESLFVPIEPGTKVPVEAYTAAYTVALAREAHSYYYEFIEGDDQKPATKQLFELVEG